MKAKADWRQIPARAKNEWIVGVDLGKSMDATAIAVMHHTITPTGNWIEDRSAETFREESTQRFDLLHLQRLPLGVNYVVQAHTIAEIMQREPLKSANADLVVDQSGVGAGVVDLMETVGLRPIRIQITAGAETTRREPRLWNVAKSALISRLEAAMHGGTLRVAEALAESEVLRDELRDFQRHTTAAGANVWGARVGKHDDIVLATSYCVWFAMESSKYFAAFEPLGF